MKLDYIVVYENISENFDIGHFLTKVKVTAQLRNFSLFTTIQNWKEADIKYVCSSDNSTQYLMSIVSLE